MNHHSPSDNLSLVPGQQFIISSYVMCTPHACASFLHTAKTYNSHDFTLSQSSLYHCWKLYPIVYFFSTSSNSISISLFGCLAGDSDKQTEAKTMQHTRTIFSLVNPYQREIAFYSVQTIQSTTNNMIHM